VRQSLTGSGALSRRLRSSRASLPSVAPKRVRSVGDDARRPAEPIRPLCLTKLLCSRANRAVPDLRLVYLGDDAEGRRLEVIAVETGEDELLVIHAMPLRSKYKPQYEEACKWRL
jgi:hypothetical protein